MMEDNRAKPWKSKVMEEAVEKVPRRGMSCQGAIEPWYQSIVY
jgi:hypothetical protein